MTMAVGACSEGPSQRLAKAASAQIKEDESMSSKDQSQEMQRLRRSK
jgi:hypothetical protein